jgi:hypothetical protein
MYTYKRLYGGWGFSSVVERLPSKPKALGSVLSSGKKKKKVIWVSHSDRKSWGEGLGHLIASV